MVWGSDSRVEMHLLQKLTKTYTRIQSKVWVEHKTLTTLIKKTWWFRTNIRAKRTNMWRSCTLKKLGSIQKTNLKILNLAKPFLVKNLRYTLTLWKTHQWQVKRTKLSLPIEPKVTWPVEIQNPEHNSTSVSKKQWTYPDILVVVKHLKILNFKKKMIV